MASLNKAILIGNLTADPELKQTPSGISVVSFTIAVDRNFARQGEQRATDFISCVAWRNQAEFLSKYFVKGQLLALSGSIQTRQYDDKDGKRVFGIGGEHLVTLPEIKAVAKFHKDLAIVHFDAHTDLREEYMGEEMSHSAVIRHSSKIVGAENLRQIGIRSGMKEEFEFMKKNNTLATKYSDLDALKDKKIFITVDLDVLDTSIMPGTGTPECGGLTFNELVGWFRYLKDFDW